MLLLAATYSVKTLPQLQTLQADTWVMAGLMMVLALAVAVVIAWLIPWQGGRVDSSYKIRRWVFIPIGVFAPLVFWFWNAVAVAPGIRSAGFRQMFQDTNIIAAGTILAGYFLLGIVMMWIWRNTKWGSILGLKH